MPSLSWNTLLQYDTISQNANVNSVVSYEISPGQRAFVVVNQDVGISEGFKLTAVSGQISMKLGMTLIF